MRVVESKQVSLHPIPPRRRPLEVLHINSEETYTPPKDYSDHNHKAKRLNEATFWPVCLRYPKIGDRGLSFHVKGTGRGGRIDQGTLQI